MELKHNMEMYHNKITQSDLAIKNKDSVIEQLRNQINEMNEEIEERMNDLKIYEENNQMGIQEYNDKIQELLEEKKFLQNQNDELSMNLIQANNTLKEYNDVIINKYQNLEEELNLEKNDKINLEQKYKSKIKEFKNKNNYLTKENNRLKNLIQHYKNRNIINTNKNHYTTNNLRSIYDFNSVRNKNSTKNSLLNVNDYLNKTMFYNYDTNNALNGDDTLINKNNNIQFFDMNLTYQDNSINPFKNIKKISTNTSSNYFDENPNQSEHNRTINEFKDLLKKIDEKLYNDNI